jgi:hypothetical protein
VLSFYPCLPLSRLPANCEQQFCLLQINVDSSSLDEALHTPTTLMAGRSCPQSSSFPGLSVYHYLVYSDDWSENPCLGKFLLHFDKELAGIPSSVVHLILLLILPGLGKLYPLFILVIAHSCFPEYVTQGFGVVILNYVPIGLW